MLDLACGTGDILFGAALSAKRGDDKASGLKGASKSMYKSMRERELEEFAATARKGKPQHVTKH